MVLGRLGRAASAFMGTQMMDTAAELHFQNDQRGYAARMQAAQRIQDAETQQIVSNQVGSNNQTSSGWGLNMNTMQILQMRNVIYLLSLGGLAFSVISKSRAGMASAGFCFAAAIVYFNSGNNFQMAMMAGAILATVLYIYAPSIVGDI